jgi:hypothetical protein
LRIAAVIAMLAPTIGAVGLDAMPVSAATVTVGSPLTSNFEGSTGIGPTTRVNTALGDPSANVASPVEGRVVRWSLVDASLWAEGTGFQLLVLRPAGEGTFTREEISAPAAPFGTSAPTDLPIRVGDLVGLEIPEGSKLSMASVPGSTSAVWSPPLAPGVAAAPWKSLLGLEMGFNAQVAPRPGISALTLSSGSVSGGTPVAILGHDFIGSVVVSFGATPAASSVPAENLILAMTPPSARPGPVDVTVSADGGASAPVDAARFTYTACVVPKLRRRKLRSARRKLRRARCRLGKVRPRKRRRAARVRRQRPKPGAVLPPGGRVSVRLR